MSTTIHPIRRSGIRSEKVRREGSPRTRSVVTSPCLIEYPFFQELIARGEVELLGVANPESTWVGVPLVADGRQLGIVVVQSYTAAVHYTKSDLDLLVFVAQHVANALVRARAIEETRERNAELAIINEVQRGLAEQLEMQAMYDLVGEKVRSIFDAQAVDIAILDAVARSSRSCSWSSAACASRTSRSPTSGSAKHLVETREPLLITHDMATVVRASARRA